MNLLRLLISRLRGVGDLAEGCLQKGADYYGITTSDSRLCDVRVMHIDGRDPCDGDP